MTTTRHNAANSSKVKALARLKKVMSNGELADYIIRRHVKEYKVLEPLSSPLRKDIK
jgi:hypothetical protein